MTHASVLVSTNLASCHKVELSAALFGASTVLGFLSQLVFLFFYAGALVHSAQRLLRKVCPECKQVDTDLDDVLLHALGFTDEDLETTTFYKPTFGASCRTCKGVGYKGRQAISEALYFTGAIRHLIVTSGDSIDDDIIRELAVKEGMLTLRASAREIVKRGDTSIKEILRVTTVED